MDGWRADKRRTKGTRFGHMAGNVCRGTYDPRLGEKPITTRLGLMGGRLTEIGGWGTGGGWMESVFQVTQAFSSLEGRGIFYRVEGRENVGF